MLDDIKQTLGTKVEEHKMYPIIDAFIIGVIICTAVFITTFFIYERAIEAQKGEIREGLERTARIVASQAINPEVHKTFVSQAQKTSPDYLNAIKPFIEIMAMDKSLVYMYTVVLKDEKAYFVLDAVPYTEPDSVEIMSEYVDAPADIMTALNEQRVVVSKDPYTDKWGTFITAYAPFFDKENNFVGVVGLTVDIVHYVERLQPIKSAASRALVTGLSLSLLMGLGTWFMRRFAVEINKSRIAIMEKLRITVVTDGLTGLFNRRYFDMQYNNFFHNAIEHGKPLTVIMTDVDHFKMVNDTYGHVPGDEVLQQVARRLMHSVRLSDMVARYGGEEFVVLLPDTDMDTALNVAERIRAVIEEKPFKISAAEGILAKTTSLGIATLRAGDTMNSLLKRADAGLYVAKEGGRNQVGIAD